MRLHRSLSLVFFFLLFFSKPFPGGGGAVYRDRRFVFDVDRKWNARRTLAVIAFRAFPATSSGLSSPGYREIDRRTEIDRDRSNLSDEKCILCSSPRAHPLRARVVYKVVSLSLYIGFRWLATRLEAIAATRSAVSIYYSDRSLRNVATGWINASKLGPPFPRLTEQSRIFWPRNVFQSSIISWSPRSRCSRIGRRKEGGFFPNRGWTRESAVIFGREFFDRSKNVSG